MQIFQSVAIFLFHTSINEHDSMWKSSEVHTILQSVSLKERENLGGLGIDRE